MRRALLILFLCGAILPAFSQNETAHWFLNNNHLTITPGGINNVTPTGISPAFNPYYSSTSVSDAAGNLLFAFGGSAIVDRNYNVMPAMAGNPLLNVTNSKSLAVNIPNSSKYYVFYSLPNAASANASWTLKYAIVDMSLRGGLGDVIMYDKIIASDLSQGFTLAQGDNSIDSWLVTHRWAKDTFAVYSITAAGLSTTPVISKAGTIATTENYVFADLKTSPNGKFIAGTAYRDYTNIFASTYGFVEVFNFDAITGLLTYKIRTIRLYGYYSAYQTVEFSADNRLLYAGSASRISGLQPCGFGSSAVIQYNLCYTDSLDFYKYAVTVANNFAWCAPTASWGRIQLGADKKIHMAYSGIWLPELSNPNRIGSSCNYSFGAYTLPNNNYSNVVVPSFHHKLLEKATKNNIVYHGGCHPNPVSFEITNDTITSIAWDFGDPAGAGNTSAAVQPSHVFSAPGIYTVTAQLYNHTGGFIETVTEKVEIKDPLKRLLADYPKDTTICAYNSLNMKLSVINGLFYWTFKPLNATAAYSQGVSDSLSTGTTSGTYYVQMRQNDCNGCIMIDSIQVNVLPVPNVSLGYDQTLCTGDSIKLAFYDPAASYTWSTGSNDPYIWIKQGGSYWVRGEYNNNGCPKYDTVLITQVPGAAFTFPNDTTLCNNQTLLLKPGVPNANYNWQDGSYQNSFTVNKAGKYWVRVTTQSYYCTRSDTINVAYINAQQVSLGNDSTLCLGDSLKLGTGIANATYLWNDGSAGDSITVKQAGRYWLKVDNGSCTVTDTIDLSFSTPPTVYLGKDTTLCQLQPLVLHAGVPNAAYTWINGSKTESLPVTQPGNYWVQVKKDACTVADTIAVSFLPLPALNLGKDTAICVNSVLLLNAYNSDIAGYSWQDLSTQSSFTVQQAGTYWVKATGLNGCTKADTIVVTNKPLPVFDLGRDTVLCDRQVLAYRFTLPGAAYLWNDGSMSGVFSISQPGLYWLEAVQNGCTRRDSITVSYKPLPVVQLGNDTMQCEGAIKVVDAYYPGATYQWNNGATTSAVSISKPGQYIAAVSLDGCVQKDTIEVSYTYLPRVYLGRDTELCNGQLFVLAPQQPAGSRFLWQDGSVNPTYTVTQAGIYTLTVTNDCGSGSGKMIVTRGLCQLLLPNVFTPNHDGNNDLFRVKSPGFIRAFHMQVYSRWGQLVYNSTDARGGWDGKYKGEDMTAGNYIWTIYLVDLDGNAKTAKGSVLLIR